MFSRASIGFQASLGPSHKKCQGLSSAITPLSHFQGMDNEIIASQLELDIKLSRKLGAIEKSPGMANDIRS